MLVVNDADGHILSSEAANDSKALVVAADHDGTDGLLRGLGNGPGCL